MQNTTDAKPQQLEEKLADIELHLKEIRQDVSQILRSVQDELDAFREREFWRDYGNSYQQD
jgi:hypothetical protein